MKNVTLKFIKYISLFVFFIFLCILNNSTISFAATPRPSDIIGFRVRDDIDGCGKKWSGKGQACTVSAVSYANSYGCDDVNTRISYTFTSNDVQNVTRLYPDKNGRPNMCGIGLYVRVYNFDDNSPVKDDDDPNFISSGESNGLAKITSGTCNVKETQTARTITCATAPKICAYFRDSQSGIPAGKEKVCKTCKIGEVCHIYGQDAVGNKSDSSHTDLKDTTWTGPYNIKVNKDSTKCSKTSISITSGTKYNGYYVGTVTCTAKCTADNLAVGSAGTGTTTGTVCSAKACDKAGNCTPLTINVKRDTTPPKCTLGTATQEGVSNGYWLGKVTATWKGSDAQSGMDKTSFSASTNDNSVSSLGMVIKDRAGNSTTCPNKTWNRDNKSPTKCSVTYSGYSNSSVTATAKCAADGESGCSSSSDSKTYYANGSYSGTNGIRIYDLTQNYGATPKNYLDCTVTIGNIDKAKPTCTAKINVANPVLSNDGKTWTTNTWHNASANIYDENGKATANGKNRVQATVNTYNDPTTADSSASGVKTPLGSESTTTLNEGDKNGIYTVFVRDKVIDTVTNSLSGWSASTLYAHGLTTTGNVGSCSANVYSFDNTSPVAHVQLMNKQLDGNYSVWSGSNSIQNVTTGKVNNNQNSVTFWSSTDITVQYWGTDPQGGYQFAGNPYNGRSGIKRLCYRMTNPNVNGGATSAWNCSNIADQQDGNATTASRYKTMTVPAATYPGITTVYVKVQDWAGNWSSEVSQKTYIDIEEPRIGADTSTMKKGFTETTNGQNYNNMKNPIYGSEMLSRPWVNTLVNSVFSGSDNVSNQYAGAYQFGYMWTNEKFTAAQLNASTNWRYYNDTDKTAGIAAGAKNFTLKGITNPNRTDYYYLYVRVCDNVKIGSRNCEIFESQLVRYDNDKPNIDNIIDVTNNEKDEDALSVVDGHGWTNKLKVKVMTHDEPNDGERAQVAYIKFKWNTNPDTKNEDKSKATFDSTENGYSNSSSSSASYSESGWTYVKCTNEDADANYCAAEIDFNKFVKGTSPVKEGWRFLKVAIVDKAGNVSGNNGIVFGPYRFDLTPPLITGLEFRGHRADNGAEIVYSN